MTDRDTEEKVARYQSYTVGLARIVRRAFDRGIREVTERMEAILDKVSDRGGFGTRQEAEEFLRGSITPGELSSLYAMAYSVKDEKTRLKIIRRLDMESYRHGYSISRALRDMLEIQAVRITEEIESGVYPVLRKVSLQSYGRAMFAVQKSADMGFSVSAPPDRLIDKAITSRFRSTSRYVDTVTYSVREAFMAGIVSGKSMDSVAKDISEAGKKDIWVSKAYARTMLCEVSNEVEKEAMEEAGLDKYQYVCTLDERTCPVCGSMDGREFPLSKSRAGVNFPPMHRNCRCTTAPVLTDEAKAGLTRIYSLHDEKGRRKYSEVPVSMTYEEWADKYYRL